jgi:V/A-type H+-transporting ATPase subunit E
MTEELQHLIDRIKTEAVSEAEQEAESVLRRAGEKAAGIVKTAEEQAAATLERAEQDAGQFEERSRRTLEQAARDLLITVNRGVEDILGDLVHEALEEAFSADKMQDLLSKVIDAYISNQDATGGIEVLVGQDVQESLVAYFRDRYRSQLNDGVQIRLQNDIVKGFKISSGEERGYHDFTKEAVAEALTHFLRPHLAEILKQAAAVEDAQVS